MENINIDKVLRTNPFLALDISDIEEIALKYLPYSLGIEVECDNSPTFNIEEFKSIPDLIALDIDPSEKRFRIPSGLKGLLCIYTVCEKLKTNCLLTESGIHVHCDFSDIMDGGEISYYNFIKDHSEILNENREFILQELDKWEYKNTYNKRGIGGGHEWIRLQPSFQTFEFRIIEMTFDYEVLIRRLFHLSLICNLLKAKCLIYNANIYLNNITEKEEIENTINNRIINIYNQEKILTEN